MMKMLLKNAVSLLFPSPCIVCGYLGESLCDRCIQQMRMRLHVRKLKTSRQTEVKVACCMLYQHETILGRLIQPFKYKHQADLFRYFVPFMREAIWLLGEVKDLVLVPVPLHRKRLLERGYNQSELFCRWLAKDLGCEWSPLLKRVKDTGHQARVNHRKERQENMCDAFELAADLPAGRQIVLVDDIVTTGSTLLACAEVLHEAGIKKVKALTLANREKENPWNRCLS